MKALVRYLPARGFLLTGLLNRVSAQLKRDTRLTQGLAIMTETCPVVTSLTLC